MTRIYGKWAGNPEGQEEDPEGCVEEVRSKGAWSWQAHQCYRKRGHGPKGERCKQHAKMLEEHANKLVENMEPVRIGDEKTD